MQESYNINDITDNICKFLKDLYPDFKVYDFDPTQGLQIPCFIVKPVNESFKKRIGLAKSTGIRGIDNIMFSIHTIVKEGEHLKLRSVTQNLRIRLVNIPDEYGGFRTYAMNDNYGDYESNLLFRIKVSTFINTAEPIRMENFEFTEEII